MAKPLLVHYSPYIYAVLRVIVGLSFALHGSQKIFGIPGHKAPIAITSLLGVGGLIELICGLLIALRLWASYAAFLASGEMAAAYWMMHAPKGLLPILNGGELSVLYCFLFLYIAAVPKNIGKSGQCLNNIDHLLRATKNENGHCPDLPTFVLGHGSGVWSVDAGMSKTDNNLSTVAESGN